MTRDEARSVAAAVQRTAGVRLAATGTDGGRWRVCVVQEAAGTTHWVYSSDAWEALKADLPLQGAAS